ncbi:hypothetical protein [Streptomyces pseudovenezuelae]|uniref:hypothetical protein n=1 Tax=Streptomyces pseudovenezuelae TaxID=67350 RepID=UPI002E812C14|nr:hypothetical protein [Streptomyces pseudovenezuelae]WUA94530.1 hypothetical protein OHO81_44965 [Streptomyces pseudovenezuelae]
MSAAEPAHPAPPGPGITPAHGADVIPLTKRRDKRGPASRSGRWNPMDNHQPTTPPSGDRNRTDLERVADYVEKSFNALDRTLSNDETALVFVRSLDVFVHVLAGAHAKGIITEGQRDDLVELLDALRTAPDLV